MTKQKSNKQTILPMSQRVKLVENVIKHYRELDSNFDSVYKLFGNADSKFSNSVWNTFSAYTDSVSLLIDDPFGMLDWYIFENKCGKAGMACKLGKKTYKIKTVRNLIDYIDAVNQS
jgi:hypothetical protein